MSRIRANQFTDKAGTGAPTFPNGVQVTGVATATSFSGALTGNVTGNINSSGISTLGNTVVGGGTTQLVVTGNARITGILTIGTSSITLDGSNNQVNVGTGVTLHHTNGIQVGGNNLHSTVLTVNQINASGVITATSFSGDGTNLTNTGSTLSAASGSQRVVLTGQTSGTMTASATDSALTFAQSTGTLSATKFSGDGSALTGIAATTDVRTNSLVVSGITTVAAGSAAAPSISPTGDSNTGIFFPSADTIAFGEGGAEALRINSSGQVGIGTNSPSEILDCKGNIVLGAQNAASATLQPTSSSGTDISGSALILRSGRSTGSGSSGEIQLLASPGSTVSGTTVRNNGNSGLYIKQSPGGWDDHPSLGLLTAVFGSSIAQANRSGLTGDGTVLTIDGLDTQSQSALEIVGSSNAGGGDQCFIRFFGSANKNPYATIVAVTPGANYTSGNLEIRTYNAGVQGTVATFTNTRELLIGTSTRTANGGVLQVSNGITFPATQSACSDVNTLDDYEEGTWTPNIGGNATYTSRNGQYIKVGGVVTIWGFMWVSTRGTGSQNTISGLPFNASGTCAGTVYRWYNSAVNVYWMGCAVNGGAASIDLAGQSGLDGTSEMNINAIGDNMIVHFSATYNTVA